MKWHELPDKYGYPIAFRWPTWKDGDYVLMQSPRNNELYLGGNKVDPVEALFGALGSLYFHWYEHEGWEPLFGFY